MVIIAVNVPCKIFVFRRRIMKILSSIDKPDFALIRWMINHGSTKIQVFWWIGDPYIKLRNDRAIALYRITIWFVLEIQYL